MSDTDNSKDSETVLNRRSALKGGLVAIASAIAPIVVSRPAVAQSTEPRLQLGGDWAIDDDSDGSGNNDLRIEHQPSGAEFRYDVSAGAWIPNQPIGTSSDRQNHYGDTGDYNSADVTNDTFIKSVLDTSTSSQSSNSWVTIADTEQEDIRGEQDSSLNINPDESGWYEISASALAFETSDQDTLKLAVRDVDSGTTVEREREKTSGSLHGIFKTFVVYLDSGTNYKVQFTDVDTSFKLSGSDQETGYVVRKSVVHP